MWGTISRFFYRRSAGGDGTRDGTPRYGERGTCRRSADSMPPAATFASCGLRGDARPFRMALGKRLLLLESVDCHAEAGAHLPARRLQLFRGRHSSGAPRIKKNGKNNTRPCVNTATSANAPTASTSDTMNASSVLIACESLHQAVYTSRDRSARSSSTIAQRYRSASFDARYKPAEE